MTAVYGDPPLPMDIESVIGMLPMAWDRVLARRAGAGIDGMTVESFRADAPGRLRALGDRLRAGVWQPRPGRRLRLESDPERPIVVPTVEDRIVQRAVALVLSPWVERELGLGARAYRPGRDMGSTTQEIERHIRSGRVWFARTDIEKFFDRLDRARVQAALLALGAATEVVAVIVRLLGVGAIEGLAWHDTGEGVSQGSALSPLLSNLYLAPVDRVMAARGALYFRYADDVLVLAETEVEAAEALARFGAEIEACGLRLKARKTSRGHVGAGLDYLGVRFDGAGRAGPTRGLAAFAERVAELVVGSPEDLGRAATLVGEYERWYGDLREVQLDSLALLAAQAARYREAQDGSGLERLARCRVERFSDHSLPPAVHVQMVEAWSSLGDAEEVAAAVLTDARAALASKLTEADLGRLVRALGIVARELQGWNVPLERLPAVLGSAGRPRLARAARLLLHPPGQRGFAGTSGELPRSEQAAGAEGEESEAIGTVLASRLGRHATGWAREQRDPRGQRRMIALAEAPDVAAWAAHVRGRQRLGVQLVGEERMTGVLVVRLAGQRSAALHAGGEAASVLREVGLEAPSSHERLGAIEARAHDTSLAWLRAARRLGLDGLLEAAGPAERRIWIILDRGISVRDARRMLVRLAAEAGDPPPEIRMSQFPGRECDERLPVLVPLAIDSRRGHRSHWVTDGGALVASDVAHLAAHPDASATRLLELVRVGPAAGSPQRIADQPVVKALAAVPAAKRIVEACPLVRGLVVKAHRLGFLDPEERASLLEVFGHLPGVDGQRAAELALGPASPKDPRHLMLRLDRLGGHPISCARLAKRHPVHAEEARCPCAFRAMKPPAYPTPLLHGLHPRDIPAFRFKSRGPPRPAEATPVARPIEPVVDAGRSAVSAKTASEVALRLVRRLKELRGHKTGIEQSIARAEQALADEFRASGASRMRVPEGTLVMLSEYPPRFAIEV